MKLITFQKTLKRATALALLFTVSQPASASHVTWSSMGSINEDDSLATIASRGMTLSIRGNGDRGEGERQNQQTRVISYSSAVDASEQDIESVKTSVVNSSLLAHPQSYENHQASFKNKLVQAYSHTPLIRCSGNPIEEISVKLFKNSQKRLSRSKERNEWVSDENLGAFFTFTNNKDEKISILVKDLNVVLPLYRNHRYSDGGANTLAPYGMDLTKDQKITGQFISRILNELPAEALKRGIKYRLQNTTMSLEGLWNFITGNNIVQLSQNTGISSQDQTWLGQHILPYLYKSCVQEKDKYYNNIGNFLTSEGLSHSKYKIGMNIADYLEYWSNVRWKMPGHFEKTFPSIYQEGVRLRAKEAGLGIPDTHFYSLSRDILPYLYKSCVQEAENYYSNIGRFLTPEGLNHSKYAPGMNLADYLTYWSGRWEMPGHFEKTFSEIYREGLEEKAKVKAKDFGISESDYTALSKHILPYLYKSCVHAKDKYYNNMWNFLTPEGLEHSKYNPGMNIADYLTYWSGRWEMPGLFEETFPGIYRKGLEERGQ